MQCVLFTKFLSSLPIREVAGRVKEMGFDGVDLPVRGGAQITHETARKALLEAAKIFREEGLSLPMIVTGLKRGDEPHAEEVFASAAEAGVKVLRTASWAFRAGDDYWKLMEQGRRDLESLEPLARKFGVKANFQIHSGGCLNSSCAASAMMLKDRDPQFVGLQLDPGHLALSGEKIEMALSITGAYLHSVNVKSPRHHATADPPAGRFQWRVVWVPLAEGLVNWRLALKNLKGAGYAGLLSLHAEYPVERSVELAQELVTNDLRYLRQLLQEIPNSFQNL